MKTTISKADLQTEMNRLRASEHYLLCALNDALSNETEWMSQGAYSLGISRIASPEGPTVVIRYNPGGQKPYASAHRWEDCWTYARNLIPCDQEQRDYRDLFFTANAFINRKLAELSPVAA